MADDWGCFNADPDVIQGLIYSKMKGMTVKKIQDLIDEYIKGGLLFLWKEGERVWGYFVSWDSHHNYCNKTNADNNGKHQKHRRKTPEPPVELLSQYLQGVSGSLGHLRTPSDKILSPSLNPIPNPIPKPAIAGFDRFWKAYPRKKSKGAARKVWEKINPSEQLLETMISTIGRAKTSIDWTKKAPDGGNYIPHPATWLNAQGWEDEYDPVQASDQKRVCTAEEPAPRGAEGWTHPKTTLLPGSTDAMRCVHCKKIFYS